MTYAAVLDTRNAIISAAFACFRSKGLRRTTMVDIARAADLSRSTVYEYFRDKGKIVEACAEVASQSFYRKLATAIDRDGGSTLEEKLVRASVFVSQARRIVEPESYFDQEMVDLMLTKNAATLLQECGDFFAAYISAAKLSGEVRSGLDIHWAAEWFARILFSLFTTPSPLVDLRDDKTVAEFVRPYVVRGFAEDRTRRDRKRDGVGRSGSRPSD